MEEDFWKDGKDALDSRLKAAEALPRGLFV